MDNMPDWSRLLPDLLVGVALRLRSMEDFTAFRGVCIKWRAAGAIKGELFKDVSKVPLLMLSEKNGSDEREFYSFVERNIFLTMPVPEAKGKRCIYAGFGWILGVSASPNSIGGISLFNPFSSYAKIELPNINTLPKYEEDITGPEYCFVKRGMLSADPSVTSDFRVFVVGNFTLGLWRNGDKSWTRMDVDFGECGSICYYQGKLCAINIYGKIFVGDAYGIDETKARIIHWKDPTIPEPQDRMPYLVESSDGELLIILRNNYEWHETVQPNRIELMRVDTVKMECEEINDIGKEAIFLGDNITTSIAATEFSGVKPNCIYFTDDCWQRYTAWLSDPDDNGDSVYESPGRSEDIGGTDMGIYNVKDGSFERFDVESYSHVCPPLWIFPSF